MVGLNCTWKNGGRVCRTRYVTEVAITFMETFAGIILRPQLKPLRFRYMQFANVSAAERIIAPGPPYNRNVTKIRQSEKLIANFDRGKVSVIRGATKRLNARRKKYPNVSDEEGNVENANARHAAPKAITTALTAPLALRRLITALVTFGEVDIGKTTGMMMRERTSYNVTQQSLTESCGKCYKNQRSSMYSDEWKCRSNVVKRRPIAKKAHTKYPA